MQTERYLLDNYLAKHTTFGNIQTESVAFTPRIEVRNMLVQTLAVPKEEALLEPLSIILPDEPMPYLPEQHNESGSLMENDAPLHDFDTVEVPVQKEPSDDNEDHERMKDWSNSILYTFIRSHHTRYLLDKGLIRLFKGDTRPSTPKEYKNLTNK